MAVENFDYSEALKQISIGCIVKLTRYENEIIDSDSDDEDNGEEAEEEENKEDEPSNDSEHSTNAQQQLLKQKRISNFVPDSDQLEKKNDILDRCRDKLSKSEPQNSKKKNNSMIDKWRELFSSQQRLLGPQTTPTVEPQEQNSFQPRIKKEPGVHPELQEEGCESTDSEVVSDKSRSLSQNLLPSVSRSELPKLVESNFFLHRKLSIYAQSIFERQPSSFVQTDAEVILDVSNSAADNISTPTDEPSEDTHSNPCTRTEFKDASRNYAQTVAIERAPEESTKNSMVKRCRDQSSLRIRRPRGRPRRSYDAELYLKLGPPKTPSVSGSELPKSVESTFLLHRKFSMYAKSIFERQPNLFVQTDAEVVLDGSNSPADTASTNELFHTEFEDTSRNSAQTVAVEQIPEDALDRTSLPIDASFSASMTKSDQCHKIQEKGSFESAGMTIKWKLLTTPNVGDIKLKKLSDLLPCLLPGTLDQIMYRNCVRLTTPSEKSEIVWYNPFRIPIHKATSTSPLSHLTNPAIARKNKVPPTTPILNRAAEEPEVNQFDQSPVNNSHGPISHQVKVPKGTEPFQLPVIPSPITPTDAVEIRDRVERFYRELSVSVNAANQEGKGRTIPVTTLPATSSIPVCEDQREICISVNQSETSVPSNHKTQIHSSEVKTGLQSSRYTNTASRGGASNRAVGKRTKCNFIWVCANQLNSILSMEDVSLQNKAIFKLRSEIGDQCLTEPCAEDFLIKVVQEALKQCFEDLIQHLKSLILKIIDETIQKKFQIIEWPLKVEKIFQTPRKQKIPRKRKMPNKISSPTQNVQQSTSRPELPQASGVIARPELLPQASRAIARPELPQASRAIARPELPQASRAIVRPELPQASGDYGNSLQRLAEQKRLQQQFQENQMSNINRSLWQQPSYPHQMPAENQQQRQYVPTVDQLSQQPYHLYPSTPYSMNQMQGRQPCPQQVPHSQSQGFIQQQFQPPYGTYLDQSQWSYPQIQASPYRPQPQNPPPPYRLQPQNPPSPYYPQPFLTTSQQLSQKSENVAMSMRSQVSVPTALYRDVSRMDCSPPAANIAPSLSHLYSMVTTVSHNSSGSNQKVVLNMTYQGSAAKTPYRETGRETLNYSSSYQNPYPSAGIASHNYYQNPQNIEQFSQNSLQLHDKQPEEISSSLEDYSSEKLDEFLEYVANTHIHNGVVSCNSTGGSNIITTSTCNFSNH